MSEVILTIIIGILLGYIGYIQFVGIKEREKLLKMFMAKDLREVTDNEALEKIPEQEPIKSPDIVSMDDAIDDEKLFDRHIEAVKLQAKEELAKEYEK